MITMRYATIALALLVVTSSASAQVPAASPRVESARPAPSATAARVADTVARLLLAGDRRKLEAYLARASHPSVTGRVDYRDRVTDLLDAASSGGRTIVDTVSLGSGRVGIRLAERPDGEATRILALRLDGRAKILSIRLTSIEG